MLSRRDFLYLGLAATAGLVRGADAGANVHEQILALAAKLQEQRRARFAAVNSKADLLALQKSLRQKFLDLIDGLPERGSAPPVKKVGQIDGDDYVIEKLVFESFPAYLVPALLYRPKKIDGKVPGILSPCGHAHVGKAAGSYQIAHINLVKRGNIILTFDPVGQGERSQFWDAEKEKSRFNLGCGEHCVLGNPMYLLGTSLARYRIHDGLSGVDYLTSLPDVDAKRIGCLGSSGGGTLTAYIAALDPRVHTAVISCYLTTLPRRMGNRIQRDPESDPEQDIFDFVSGGIDHAGLLALRAPLPTQVNAAIFDFFPIEGARESYEEAKKLYKVADAASAVHLAEAQEKHGLTLPQRQSAYAWFDQWLHRRQGNDVRDREIAVEARPTKDLLVCSDGQVNVTFKSRHLFLLAVEQFKKRKPTPRVPLKDLLRLDPEQADFHLQTVAAPAAGRPLVVAINGIDAPAWNDNKTLATALKDSGTSFVIVDPRGVGKLRPDLSVKGREYGDPLVGVEENIAYNAFLIGRSLVGMRVADVLAAVKKLRAEKPGRIVLLGRRDAALVACLAAAVDSAIDAVAVEEMMLSFWPLFDQAGQAINASYLLPGMLRDFGDMGEVLTALTPRKALVAAPANKGDAVPKHVHVIDKRFSDDPKLLIDWLGK
ncbi:MAG: acetylxylan esterase [Gemmataceae bacterium]|nr:acetylxylan esterase [Gemmataceae bacterium]